ncbi:MAG: MjaI family restriction endonuclease [Bacteroidota bacterium]
MPNLSEKERELILKNMSSIPKKATKEFLLNYSFNRWQLNRQSNVGALSKNIRLIDPDDLNQWKEKYEQVEIKNKIKHPDFKKKTNSEWLIFLGKKLYTIVKHVISKEQRFAIELVNSITLEDCIDYIEKVVYERTFTGYYNESLKG